MGIINLELKDFPPCKGCLCIPICMRQPIGIVFDKCKIIDEYVKQRIEETHGRKTSNNFYRK